MCPKSISSAQDARAENYARLEVSSTKGPNKAKKDIIKRLATLLKHAMAKRQRFL